MGGLLPMVTATRLFAETGAIRPYETDDSTLHLWHLDEAGPPFRDEGRRPFALRGLLNRAEAGEPSLAGMGESVTFHRNAGGARGTREFKGGILLAMPRLAAGSEDRVPDDFGVMGDDGAFTYEALVKFDLLPAESGTVALGVITMDGEQEERCFNFRVEKGGFLAFIPLASRGGALAAIPASGPHAIERGPWFHVAVTYDGNEGAPNNLTLYWTRLDSGETEAHLIGRGSMENDLPARTGDFAIGNEARSEFGIGEAEPFDGWIDEVRISSVARSPNDFLLTPPEKRGAREVPGGSSGADGQPQIRLTGLRMDGEPWNAGEPGVVLPPGPHRLDFDFEVRQSGQRALEVLTRMKGGDERWRDNSPGMVMVCEVLDREESVLSVVQFPLSGASRGWRTTLEDSQLVLRNEPLQVPDGGTALRLTLSSGADDTTGVVVCDDLRVLYRRPDGRAEELWGNSGFSEGERLDEPDGVPKGWSRSGSAPTIGRLVTMGDNPSLALIDGDQAASGAWSRTEPLPDFPVGGVTLLLQWREVYNVIGGNIRRVTFPRVPAGEYAFEVAASTVDDVPLTDHFLFPVRIRTPFWSRPWFWALVVALVATSIAVGVIGDLRRRAERRLAALEIKNALASDRARIARDMHDDLGTRITLMTMNAALAQRAQQNDPPQVVRHLGNLSRSARELVESMESLVWSVDPANDSLDQFAERVTRMVEEVFQDSGVRATVDVPLVLPDWPLKAAARHHLVFAVKEALHNVLRHAGPCDATLSLKLSGSHLMVEIEDRGVGFDPSVDGRGNGLGNLKHRLERIGGTCIIESGHGRGTKVSMGCPLAELLRNPDDAK
ncbi:hypothetical protein Hsar01_03551 [Haloferula sargassicola]|uniref:Oxygen sensor histidine kinase NreB n=2 Tax=Haloferula sargassicola TaxID=490096 RepID=A0ABP9UY84_9BACT